MNQDTTVKIKSAPLRGVITANASKSVMQRACAAAMLRTGSTRLTNAGNANDDEVALSIIENMGATLVRNDRVIDVKGCAKPWVNLSSHSASMFCGESGLSIRMFTPLAALSGKEVSISGTGSLLKRPMDDFAATLTPLGVQVQSMGGFLPIQLNGQLNPAHITIDGSLSSQYLTGLLMAYGALPNHQATIRVNNLKSRPYTDLTLQVMKTFGLRTPKNNNYESFEFDQSPMGDRESFLQFSVEGDWSGAAFWLVAGALGGPITVKGLHTDSAQGDKAILQAIERAGALIVQLPDSITVTGGSLTGFEFDATDCPDLFPPLVALAAHCQGETRIQGLQRLRHKESDRGQTLKTEFAKMGVQVELEGDLMTIRNSGVPESSEFFAHHDHRIAMACAVAATPWYEQFTIRNANAVNKSYPDFWKDMQALAPLVQKIN